MHPEEFYTIAELEKVHWWYRCLHDLVLSHIESRFKSKEVKIIDAGCGTGGLLSYLAEQGYDKVRGFDGSQIAVDICKKRNLDVFKGDLKAFSSYFSSSSADVIICNDALYFFNPADQRTIIRSMISVLKPCGLLLINLPALIAFKGIHDIRVAIPHRVNKAEVRGLLKDIHVHISLMYWPFLLSPLIWLARFFQRIKMRSNVNFEVRSDVRRPNAFLNSMLYIITKTENRILKSNKPFGSSLFIVLRVL
jgi:SAM-dependent methyltransferase